MGQLGVCRHLWRFVQQVPCAGFTEKHTYACWYSIKQGWHNRDPKTKKKYKVGMCKRGSCWRPGPSKCRNSWAQKKCPMSCAAAGKFAGKPDTLGRKSARGMLPKRKIDMRK